MEEKSSDRSLPSESPVAADPSAPTTAGDFSRQAEHYARSRPGYPDSLIDRLIERVGVIPGTPVADVGAGTGLFANLLAHRGLAVTAVEPNAEMRHHATVARGVVWLEGSFEATGLATASQRWVTAAQAFHWATAESALPELARVLAPGGHLTALWNTREHRRSELLTATRRVIRRLVPGFLESYRERDWGAELIAGGWFRAPAVDEERHVVPMSPERYMDFWRSHNLLNSAAGPEVMAELLDQVAALVANVETIAMPYHCQAWTVRRP